MELDNNVAELICQLEYIMGNQGYNDKTNGIPYRYPIRFCETMKDWKEIRLEDGKVGWVPVGSIEII